MSTETRTRRAAARQVLVDHLASQEHNGWTPSQARILDAFLRLAITNGFDSVTMRMIGRSVGIKAPSIYAHFPGGREEIVAESLRWHFRQFGLALLDATGGRQSPDEFWESMVRLHFVRQSTLPESNLWDLLVQTDRMAAIFPPDLRHRVAMWVEIHEDMYVAAAEDLGFEEPREAVRTVIALLEATTRWASAGSSLDDASTRAIALSRHLLSFNA
ncbi:TetR/AcrR family transcriptional regulator [Microbacterium sp. 22303]|uniref:TetR/AcrR family transcriptional regulator n=1 Tax=Microbacterium sp. 22303 TaxID=3453905 RepID=UPI003F829D0B